jgi:hypothetical protein
LRGLAEHGAAGKERHCVQIGTKGKPKGGATAFDIG